MKEWHDFHFFPLSPSAVYLFAAHASSFFTPCLDSHQVASARYYGVRLVQVFLVSLQAEGWLVPKDTDGAW